MFLPGEISSGFMNTFSSRGSSPLPPTPRWINTILFRDPSDANVRQTTCAKSEVETKPKQPARCGAVCPVPLACRKPEEAQEPRQVPALCCQPMQGQEFDFQTAPHCWKLGKRDVLNKYPKYFLAPLGFFFFLTEKQPITLAYLSLSTGTQQSQNLPERKTTHIQTVFCCFKPKKSSLLRSLSFGLTRIKQTEPISSYSYNSITKCLRSGNFFGPTHNLDSVYGTLVFPQISQT